MAADRDRAGWLLAIDTSSVTVSVAVAGAGTEYGEPGAEITWSADRNQTATLLGQIDSILHLNDIESSDLSGVAVATGPGSFSALRVGLATAKALCLAHDIPIFGVGTLDAAAAQFEGWGKPVRALVNAGRRRVVAGDYRPGLHGLTLAAALEHRTLDRLADGINEPTLLIGDLAEPIAANYRSNERIILLPPATRRRRAGILINMVHERWINNQADDLASLEPIYVHGRPEQAAAATRKP
ncbi:MAG: tRNA (adenosine(37)-N6)-threonylcarbamoyltransferase complex dimerization subunit type 1 TsaB [Thermomicrobiales bacterium]